MKVSIPEPVAAGAIAALSESTHPDVRHLVREVKKQLTRDGQDSVVSGAEWDAVVIAIDVMLTGGSVGQLVAAADRSWPSFADLKQRLIAARPKVERLMKRQQLREG